MARCTTPTHIVIRLYYISVFKICTLLEYCTANILLLIHAHTFNVSICSLSHHWLKWLLSYPQHVHVSLILIQPLHYRVGNPTYYYYHGNYQCTFCIGWISICDNHPFVKFVFCLDGVVNILCIIHWRLC